jgi:glycosyltransferase involved in cell wall biosynthesis
MTKKEATILALSLLCENPQKLTGLNSLFREFLLRSLHMDERLRWILFIASGHEFGASHERPTFVRDYPGNHKLRKRLLADHFFVSPRARQMGAKLLVTVGFVPFREAIPTVMHLNTLHHLDRSNRIDPVRRYYRRWAVNNGLRRARLVITNSQFAASQILANSPSAGPKLIQSYEGLDHQTFTPNCSPKEKEALTNSLRIPPDYILWLSNLYPYKQADLLIRAYVKLPTDLQQKHPIVFVGGDWNEQKAATQALAIQLGVTGRLFFLGWVEDRWIPALLRQARIFVFPSREETFGRPVAEAMACGTPCLVNNIPIMHEIAAGAAMITDYRDSTRTATIFQQTLIDQSLRTQLITRGLARAKAFDFNKLTRERMLAIYSVLHKLEKK